MTVRTLSLAGAVLVFGVSTLAGAEKRIQAKDLPPAVQKAVQEETKGATIKGYAKEVEAGKTMYEVETTVNGHSRDLLFDTSGRLVEVEEATTLDVVPAAVKTALEARGKVLTVETVTKGTVTKGTIVTYEAVVQKNGKKSEVAVDAAGKSIKP
jgi:uncharacterized membrane protein YkoI